MGNKGIETFLAYKRKEQKVYNTQVNITGPPPKRSEMAESARLTEQEISDLGENTADIGGQGASGAEVHRWDRRAAAGAIEKAEDELSRKNDTARLESLNRVLADSGSQYNAVQNAIPQEEQILQNAENLKRQIAEELSTASESLSKEERKLSDLEKNLAEVSASIVRSEKHVETLRKAVKSDIAHNLDRFGFKTKVNLLLGRGSLEDLVQHKMYEDRVAEIMKEDSRLTENAAEMVLEDRLALETKEIEDALQAEVDEQKEKTEQARKNLQNIASIHTEALRAVQSCQLNLDDANRRLKAISETGTAAAAAVKSVESEIAQARQNLEEKQAALQKAEEDEKTYWQALHDELVSMAPRSGESAGLSDEEFSSLQQEKSKRESVRSMLGMNDVDILAMANEIGRTAEGERSVDIAIGDMVEVTGKMVERYRILAEAASKYDSDFSALEMRTMADIDNEAFDLTREQQQIEYAKFEVLDDAQLEAALRVLDQKLDQSPEVQKLKQDITMATAYLEKPSHKSSGFKRLHQQQLREYEGIKKAGERDLKKASRDIENQKGALTKRNELQKAKAHLELANWKKEYLNKFISRSRAEAVQALDTFLGSLESFTPQERELVYKGEYQQALAEAEAILDNLKKWESLLRDPDATVAEIAKVLVGQDRLDEDAVRKYESTQSAVKLKELEMKGKRGSERDKLEEELKVLRREAKGAEVVLTQRSKKKQEAIEAIRIQHLPIELAVADPAKAGEVQFGSRKAKTAVRGVYDRVMWGGTVHETAKTEIGTVANPTDLTGVVEVYGDVGELDAVIEEEVTRQKTEGLRSAETGAEHSFDVELGDILKEGPEAIKRLVERVSVDEIRGISAEMAQRFIDTINMSIVFAQLSSAMLDHATDSPNVSKREIAQRWAVFADTLLSKTNTRDVFTDIRVALTKIPNLLV